MKDIDKRSELIEREALLSLHRHCPPETRDALGLFLDEVDDALVAGASNDPSILLNRTLGLGSQAPPSTDAIARIDAIYRERGVQRYFLHVYPDTLERGAATFEDTRLEPARGWMKFVRDDAPRPEGSTDLEVRRVGREGAQDFGRIVAGAFGMTPAAGPLLAGLVDDERWHLFVSYAGDEAAGAGSMLIDGGAAWFEWGATDPRFRRRGSQGAIMRARIDAAFAAGCKVMFTETGEAAGGDPQHSYGNIQRYGFRESVLRQNWAPPAS
jgi:GNAT superfamily N-acetyltransferase